MKLIVGLGNPGRLYSNTRHNIGFSVIDALSKKHKIELRKISSQAVYGYGRVGHSKAILAKPLTYMNLVGNCVRNLITSNIITLDDVIVIADDADLMFGKIRLRAAGSDGGHKGLRSIIEAVGTIKFNRLRIGIGRPSRSGLSQYVLDKFKKEELPFLKEMIGVSCNALETWVRDGMDVAMNNFNSLKINGGKN
ncbi:MAG: aminoacyl-tRNA hydrolase [Candidatus Omnitrophota bacterium]